MGEYEIIDQNIKEVTKNIQEAANRTGRSHKDITLVSVTKTVDVNRMKYLFQQGYYHFGENRVQELTEKYSHFNHEINWHLIGHLQTNKVKYIIDKVELIHSVDSIRLAKEIHKQAYKINRKVPILIQVNVAGEKSKFGIGPQEVQPFIREVSAYGNIVIKGLMTIAPFEDDTEKLRPIFRELKDVYDKIKKEETGNINMEYLSMGMTNDYVVAIEEGSNMVRIGSGIFGKRNI